MDVLAHPNINANNPKLIISCVLHYGEIHCNTESNVIEKHKKIFSRCVCSPPLRNPSLSSSPLLFSCHIIGTVIAIATKIRNRSAVIDAPDHCALLLLCRQNRSSNNNSNKNKVSFSLNCNLLFSSCFPFGIMNRVLISPHL